MNKTLPLIISGIIFTLFALVHGIRLLYQWELLIAGFVIPIWASTVALIVASFLAIWMFLAASR